MREKRLKEFMGYVDACAGTKKVFISQYFDTSTVLSIDDDLYYIKRDLFRDKCELLRVLEYLYLYCGLPSEDESELMVYVTANYYDMLHDAALTAYGERKVALGK